MREKLEKAFDWILLILSCGLLMLLILSDFGLINPSDDVFARTGLHISAILLIISSVGRLKAKRKG